MGPPGFQSRRMESPERRETRTRMHRTRASKAVGSCLLATVLLATLACGSSPTPTPEAVPTPTPTPQEVLERSAARMVALNTAHFTLDVEGDTSALFFGSEPKLLEGVVDMPDSFELRVEAVFALLRSFVEINMVGVGDRILIADLINEDKWVPVPAEDLPFDFAHLGRNLSDIMFAVEDPSFTALEVVDGEPSWRLMGSVPSEALNSLLPGAAQGFQVSLQGWIGQTDLLLRRLRIEGIVYSGDSPDIVRVLTIDRFDEPVDIALP